MSRSLRYFSERLYWQFKVNLVMQEEEGMGGSSSKSSGWVASTGKHPSQNHISAASIAAIC
jgi:hypothetical protein